MTLPCSTGRAARPAITHLARELDVPAPIRQLAFHQDLQAYQAKWAAGQPESRPPRSQYYGAGASLQVLRGSSPVSPMDGTVWI